ncbi:hypothetical protein A2870_00150 [Candidatus Curtissbacteria bacterium RIFCSPHIGHO2_01_FULL_41_11]|uniref:Uncharacterized protein n=1 Tax=Candidatus Curtissbacteria bacterium RIFCSPHIGHO2_01_FULL_41_11 TaxID=1797711 RepID=A0A1F5G3Q9_9BACT|nr:MAG: hypothetical protein A2870_00150 [Candidatus Curtissbacteria bacterium RIFCSPHIGHO2_01_FULL_41_11]
MNHFPVQRFPPGKLNLTTSEKKVVDKLIQAAEEVAEIYKLQENPRMPGANFYPHDATKEEILKESQKNPEILSPYTIIERKDNKLQAVPYHAKYKKQLEKIAKSIRAAAKLTGNKEFSSRLYLQADSLIQGKYEASDIYWLSMKPYKINFVIGPIERYDDKLFFTKCSYQSWIGIMDEEQTKEAIAFKDYIVSARRKVLAPSEKVEFLNKIQVRVDHTLIFSGLISRYMFTSSNLPNDVNLMEKHGSEIVIFKQSFDNKFKTQHLPIFKAVFEDKFQQGYSSSVLKTGSLRNTYLHEISHPLLRYRDAETRLKEYFPVFDEIAASVFGVRACGSLLLKNIISQKELESIIVMFIARAFAWWISYLKEPGVLHYAKGFAIALNYFLDNGAIRGSQGFSWPNFTKLFVSITELADALERILAVGTYEDAKQFVDEYASLEVFERFRGNLKKFT